MFINGIRKSAALPNRLVLALIAILSTPALAAQSAPLPSDIISAAVYFSRGANGFMAHNNDEQQALASIVASADAVNTLETVARSGSTTPAGKLYAACGLRQLNYPDLNALFAPSFTLRVSVLQGDILHEGSFETLFTRLNEDGCK